MPFVGLNRGAPAEGVALLSVGSVASVLFFPCPVGCQPDDAVLPAAAAFLAEPPRGLLLRGARTSGIADGTPHAQRCLRPRKGGRRPAG